MRDNYRATQLGGIANLALMARVRPGFVEAFETVTHARRLEVLFNAFNASRLAQREAHARPFPFQDNVGRFGLVQSFRYALMGPDDEPEGAQGVDATWRVYLNVAFDGGFEPYLRVIYRDLGSLLDAIFCNCEGYPLARECRFEDYEQWVRAHEIDAGIWFTDSALSVGDQRYLAGLERKLRQGAGPAELAAHVLPDAVGESREAFARVLRNPPHAMDLAFRSLRGLHALRAVYPDSGVHGRVLRRFARDALSDFRLLVDQDLFDRFFLDSQALPAEVPAALRERWRGMARALRDDHREELDWLLHNPDPPAQPPADPGAPPDLQAGVIDKLPVPMTHGALVMLRVTDAGLAAQALDGPLAPHTAQQAAEHPGRRKPWRQVALTWAGLRALKVPEAVRRLFPQEFADGMESRAGLLGDLRGNHPDRWERPLPWGQPQGVPIDLGTVHVVLQLRLRDADDTGHELHPRVHEAIDDIDPARLGLQVVAVQALRSWPEDKQPFTKGHFGFADGVSQPVPVARRTSYDTGKGPHWNDEVALGEVLLGHPGDRDPRPSVVDPLGFMAHGSFLVVRKLAQHVGRLNDVVKANAASPADEADLKSRLMGRTTEGAALVPANGSNDFDYRADPTGAACPFHSHVRRSNPRSPAPAVPKGDAPRGSVPRLLRRGMSYGPRAQGGETAATDGAERGLVFMAFVASLAEQFEVIQRWVAGGNASGVLSAPGDPFLGVPEPGQRRIVTWPQGGGVRRVDLGDQPLVSLRWGLYLFAPTRSALALLKGFVAAVERPAGAPATALPLLPPTAAGSHDEWQRRLEDPRLRDAAWQQVRQAGGSLQTDYGVLHGSAAHVQAAFADDGSRLSVCGYGRRMAQSLGLGYLGQDTHTRDAAYRSLAQGVNAAIEAYGLARSFDDARQAAQAQLAEERRRAQVTTPAGPLEWAVLLDRFHERVLAGLCRQWFGLPDAAEAYVTTGPRLDGTAGPPRCPGHLFTLSRWVFSPAPSATVAAQGRGQGAALLDAVRRWLAKASPVGLSADVAAAVKAWVAANPALGEDPADLSARTIAGTMLGFPPTVHGNFMKVIEAWVASRDFWAWQQAWLAQADRSGARAEALLRQPLLQRMAQDPVPAMLWRLPPEHWADPDAAPRQARHVIGIAGAMREPGADPQLMFGGTGGTHACPGREMAIGVLLGVLTTLFEAGRWRPGATGSQLLLQS